MRLDAVAAGMKSVCVRACVFDEENRCPSSRRGSGGGGGTTRPVLCRRRRARGTYAIALLRVCNFERRPPTTTVVRRDLRTR